MFKLSTLDPALRKRIEDQIRQEDRASGTPPSPEPQLSHVHEQLGQVPGTAGNGIRYGVSIKSFRTILLDPDNLCGKYFVDCLRYAGILPDDTAALVDYRICQEKVQTKDQERTEITIEEL